MKSNKRGTEGNLAHESSYQSQQVAFFRLTVYVDVQPIACHRVAQHFEKVIESSLHVDIGRIFDLAVLIEFEHLACMTTAPQLIRNQLGLNRPATHRRWVIADLEDFLLIFHYYGESVCCARSRKSMRYGRVLTSP